MPRSSRDLEVIYTCQHTHILVYFSPVAHNLPCELQLLLSRPPLLLFLSPDGSSLTHGCFSKDEFLAKGHHSFSFSAVHEAACIAQGLRHAEPSVILSVLGRDIPQAASACLPRQHALAPKRERMALVLWRKRSCSSA